MSKTRICEDVANLCDMKVENEDEAMAYKENGYEKGWCMES